MKIPKFEVPQEVRRYVQKQGDIAVQLAKYIKDKYPSQKEFAKELGMKESRLSKILAGNENLTLKSITKIEAFIGENLIEIPIFAENKEIQSNLMIVTVDGKIETTESESKFYQENFLGQTRIYNWNHPFNENTKLN